MANNSIYKLHVSFENIYFVEAGSFDEAIKKLHDEKFDDLLTRNNVTLLETISHETAEKLKKQGRKIIYGKRDESGTEN